MPNSKVPREAWAGRPVKPFPKDRAATWREPLRRPGRGKSDRETEAINGVCTIWRTRSVARWSGTSRRLPKRQIGARRWGGAQAFDRDDRRRRRRGLHRLGARSLAWYRPDPDGGFPPPWRRRRDHERDTDCATAAGGRGLCQARTSRRTMTRLGARDIGRGAGPENVEHRRKAGATCPNPMHQFEIKRLIPFELFGFDAFFTNSRAVHGDRGRADHALHIYAMRGRSLVPRASSRSPRCPTSSSPTWCATMSARRAWNIFPFVFTLFMFVLSAQHARHDALIPSP